jgi:type III secretion protein L
MLNLRLIGAEIGAHGAVIKARDYAALLSAEDVLAKAREEADLIRAEAQAEYAQQKERGYREGLEQGKAEMAERVVATMSQSNLYFSKLENVLIDVVVKSTRRVIGDFNDRERVERIVRKALELLRNQHNVRIKVPPAQAEALKARVEELLAAFPRIQVLDVQADPRLPEDGCVLETDLGVIDATVETQLRAIQKALSKALQ